MPAVIEWHYDGLLPMGDVLVADPRSSLVEGDFFVLAAKAFDPKDKRLAVEVEDHPLDYGDFEGTIPKGQYGGGTVMVWDIGTYELIEGNYYKGRLHLHLEGTKLKGETRCGEQGGLSFELTKRQ